ncbi:phage scaffolding protein [Streptococcus ictaluri]|uniref:Phage minor structural protein GP20 n=1 Tax=Streptococcus ictaluri 707-05 TaxID=764299 RepID=G5K3R8_9STRE|nr:phage scaffolding protein [Streptococcus ictaluri]EHI69917.1 phage minor structural protein GP20 [Streptococcus ictaluri 707-05]QBX25536.1 capsid and scaffold protein [Streptococcus phage Javan262]
MKREFLAGLELSDEVINQIMAEHGETVQGLQTKLDESESKLEQANGTLNTLKKNNKDNEELQSELKTYKEKVNKLEADAIETAKKQSIKDALSAAKATDVDYLMYKLGDIETDDSGALKEIDNKIKDLQDNYPNFFESNQKQTQDNPGGYQPLGGADIGNGKPAHQYTEAELSSMSPAEINENWDAIKASMQ